MTQSWDDLTARLTTFNELDAPTPKQILEAQQILFDSGLLPASAMTGEQTPIFGIVLAIATDTDLAAKVVAKTRDFMDNTTPPEHIMAAQAALTRLGYATPVNGNSQDISYNEKLEDYSRTHPLPLSPQQLNMVAEDIGGRIALELHENKVRARLEDIPQLSNQAINQLQAQNLIPQNISAVDRLAVAQYIGVQLSDSAIAIPDLKSLPPVSESQAIVMRISPDQISEGSFYTQRLAERAIWEMENKAISAAGARVIALDGSDAAGGKREVFARDRFVMVGDTAYLPDVTKYGEIYGVGADSQAYQAYESEIDQARLHLERAGVSTIDVKGSWFEGGNIINHSQSRTLFMGIEPGRDTQSATALINEINATQPLKDGRYNMVVVPMVGYDPQGIYHLDLALSEPLPGGKVLFDSSITDEYTADKIAATFGPQNIIPITADEAVAGAANILVVNNTAVLTREIERVQVALEQSGISTISARDFEVSPNTLLNDILERDQFMYGNGGMRCMGQVIGHEQQMSNVHLLRPEMSF